MELRLKKNIVKKGNIFNNLGKIAKNTTKKAQKNLKKYLKESKKNKMVKNITKKKIIA